ncbi:MAG: HAD hydrolase-like protein [Spirochaetales bacterium]|nr:HAD hydrolase-like protein [Spirochaetales bacterium]
MMNKKDFLFLFDIDGTILDTLGAGKKAFTEAFSAVLGDDLPAFELLGGIDFLIFRDAFRYLNLPEDTFNEKWGEFKRVYLEIIAGISRSTDWTLYDNTRNIIEGLAVQSQIGLVTGNMRDGARIKLDHFGLYKYFKAGSFGEDVESRASLVSNAVHNAEKVYGRTWEPKNIFLFGDTLVDVQSAIDNGIEPVLIDHKERYTGKEGTPPARYYGRFVNANLFLENVFSGERSEKLNFF